MSEFNPYREWLGLEGLASPANYYALLELSPGITDGEIIRQAADRAIGRVRSQRPGSNGQAWAALLDELNAARACLLDPGRRAEYERNTPLAPVPSTPTSYPDSAGPSYAYPPGMGGPLPSYPAPQQPQPMAVPQQPSYAAPAYPQAGYPGSSPYAPGPAMAMPGPAPGGWPMPAAPWGAPPGGYAQPASPWGTPPAAPQPAMAMPAPGYAPWPGADPYGQQPALGAAPMAMPYDPYAGQMAGAYPAATAYAAPSYPAPQAYPGPDAYPRPDVGYAASPAMTPAEIPRGTAVAPMPASEPEPEPEAPKGPEIRAREPSGAPVERDRVGGSQMLLWGGLGAAALVCVLVAVLAFPPGSQQVAAPNRPTSPGTPPKHVTPSPRPGDPKPPVIDPAIKPVPGETPDPEGPPEPAPMPGPGPKPPVDPPMPMPAPIPAPMPPMPEPKPPMPEPKPPMVAQPTPAELASLKEALTTAKQAMADRELGVAAEALAKAEKAAKLPEHQEMVARLKMLHEHATEFWSAVGLGLKGLKPTQEVKVGNTTVAVVESDEEHLVVRVAGGNKRYSKTGLPRGLALSIADSWFDKTSPTTPIFRAAFLATEKLSDDEDRAEAKRLWQEAADKGVKVGDLAKVLDDQYDKLAAGRAASDPTPEPMPKPEPKPTEVSAADKAAVVKALTAARKALGERKLDVAKRELTRIQSTAKSSEHAAQLARLERLIDHVDEFWKAFGDALKRVQAGNDLMVKGTPISLVEVGPDLLVIRATGQNQRFKKLEIPGAIVVAIAGEHLDMSKPQNRLLLGAFYAAEPRKETGTPDDAMARGLWEDAGRGGIDVAELMPVLEDKYGP